MNRTEQRNSVIDTAKGIGIFLVVCAHLNYLEPWQTIIYGFHMPLFFFISGLLFDPNRYPSVRGFIKRRIKTLILPYLLFATLSAVIYGGMHLVMHGFGDQSIKTVSSYFVQIFLAQYSQKMCNVPLWFVPCLFLAECIYYFIAKIRSKAVSTIVIILLVGIGWYTESPLCRWDFSVLPWNFSSALFSLGFYACGNYSRSILPSVSTLLEGEHKTAKLILVMTISFAIETYLALMNGHVSLGSRELQNGFLFYATGLLGTIGVFSVSSLLADIKLLRFWGKNSFYIMSTHKIFQVFLLVGWEFIFHNSIENESTHQWGISIVMIIVVMGLCSLFSVLYSTVKIKLKEKYNGRTA